MGILDGRIAAVTGAGRGIGRSGGVAAAAPADEVAPTIRGAGGEAVASYDSVATMDGGEAIVRRALDAFGRLDILVNVAGILRDRMIFNMAEEEWDAVIAVH